jgi:arylsulfatase A-like enzyme
MTQQNSHFLRRSMVATICTIWLIAAFSVSGSEPGKKPTPPRLPNVVFIFCDNLGYGDVGCFNPEAKQRTPRIDRMAAEGMKFTDCYAAAAVCTPSRAALMTGCYPRRVGLDHTDPDGLVLRPVSHNGLNPDEITVAELLKTRGYATACIGKWHLGDQAPFLPTRQGFDYYLGIPYSDDMTDRESQPAWPPLPLMENEQTIEGPVDRNLLTKRYTERTIRFIEEHRAAPFFIYLPQAMPGSTAAPFASDAFRGKSANGPWGDSVEELDWSTGEVLDALKRLDLDRDTLVIWTNDNGAPAPDRRGGSNLPLKGNAYSVAEGGMRVPFIARWPGRIPAGTVCREVITLMDVYPTLARLSGAELPADRVIDGHDIRPLLFGEPGATSPTKAFYYYFVNQLQAVRSGPWKLYLPQTDKKGAAGELQLYNLVEDPQEVKNLGGERPDLVAQLEGLIEHAREDLGELDRKGANVRPVGRVENPTPRVVE